MTMPVKHEKESSPSQRWLNPFEQMDHWFNEVMPRSWLHPLRKSWMEWPGLDSVFENKMLNIDVVEREKEVLVRAELPGVEKENIDVFIDGQRITTKASTQQEEEKESDEYYHHEINACEFSRSFILPTQIDGDKAKTLFKNGVMKITFPKSSSSKRQKIKIS